MINKEREIILDTLLEILEKNRYSHLVLRGVLDKYNYEDPKVKSFIKRIVEGTVEQKIKLDYVLDQYSKVPTAKMKPVIRTILRMSVYQLLFLDQIPDSAICNEAVKLAGKRGFRTLQGFVNGVLRSIARDKGQITYPDRQDAVRYLSVYYSMPEWIVQHFLEQYGFDKTEAVFQKMQEVAPLCIRFREGHTGLTKKAFEAGFQKAGMQLQPHPYLSYAYRLLKSSAVTELPGYEEGVFAIQDVSSMLVAEVAGLRGDETVLEVCAAPGGKSLHCADLLNQGGTVTARDLTELKTEVMEENAARLQCKNISIQVWDALQLDEGWIQKADVVLADLPCSGLGVLSKKSDIRYRLSEKDLIDLQELQKKILTVVVQYVKPGGILIYSTCTINHGENEDNVKFLTEQFDFHTESLSPFLPKELKEEGQSGMLQLLPGIHETDGFFIARLRREELN